ncbi:MAG: alpha/beta fold hydrolase [Patescibacteria group bacterium]|nr:alpha/beta fold hydrolase [Patescibacteria group bacterium]
MAKFGFTQSDLEAWKDESFTLEGNRDVGVVMLHGWSAIPRQTRPIAERLNQKGYWVHAPRLTGHGTRPEDLELATEKHWVDDTCRAVQELKSKSQIKKVIVGGISLGGNLAMLASKRVVIDGFIFLGTPIFLKNHFAIWLGLKIISPFKKYIQKKYPRGVTRGFLTNTSYQYYPLASASESIKVIRHSLKCLRKIKAPALILQTSSDYLVAKTSPWILYNSISSKNKKLQWIKTTHGGHVLGQNDVDDLTPIMLSFIKNIEQSHNT